MLFVVRAISQNRSIAGLRSWGIAVAQVLSLSLLFLGLAVGLSFMRFGSIRAGQAWVAGQRLFVENPRVEEVVDFSDFEAPLHYKIINLGNKPVSILGSSNSCACALVDELPNTIPAAGDILIHAKVKILPTNKDEPITGTIRLFTDHSNHAEINLSYHLRPVSPAGVLSDHDSRVE